jgi:hypothetical protein
MLFGDKDANTDAASCCRQPLSFRGLRRVGVEGRALFWRRLAALTCQSSPTRSASCRNQHRSDNGPSELGADYRWQTLTDRREGPLWPQVMEPHALKAWTAARFVLGDHDGALASRLESGRRGNKG